MRNLLGDGDGFARGGQALRIERVGDLQENFFSLGGGDRTLSHALGERWSGDQLLP